MGIKDRMRITQWHWLLIRFEQGVDKRGEDECWPWKKARVTDGYGTIQSASQPFATHRLAWEIKNGAIPPGMCIMHTCDNPPCCNPNHLVLGTSLDNVKDMVNKKRGSVTLSKEQVEAIKIDPRTQRRIANEYKITQSMVSLIKSGKRWHNWG
jgi:hypothetical protein